MKKSLILFVFSCALTGMAVEMRPVAVGGDGTADGHAAAAMIDGDPSTFARFTALPCSFTLDLGIPRTVRGLRLVSQPDRWVSTSPFSLKVSIPSVQCSDGNVRADDACATGVVVVAHEKALHPAFCGESQLVFWNAVTSRFVRVEIEKSGVAGVLHWGVYSTWGDWHARDLAGIPHNARDEKSFTDVAEVTLLDEVPEDAPIWNAHPARAYPASRLRKDWLLQDFGFDGFAKAAATNVPAYYTACAERRARRLARIAAECPKIVYVKHYTISGDAELTGNAQVSDESCPQQPRNFRPGGQLCLLTVKSDGTVANEVLLDCPNGCIRDPDVSHDGRTVLFSMRRSFGTGRGKRVWRDYANVSGDDFHLYTLDLETRQLKQLTFSDPARCCDFEGVWTSGGKIIFQSTRCVQVIPCHRTEAANLYVCDADGSHIRRLGYDGGATISPQELEDGRILYTRYEYNDRSARLQQPLFTMNPDGTAQEAYYGINSRFPTSLFHFRSIPGTGKVLGIVGGHHVAQKGKLAIVDPARGTEGDMGLTFVAGSDPRERPGVVPCDCNRDPAMVAARAKQDPYLEDFFTQHGMQWQNPYPLSETEWIVGFVPEGSICGSKCGDHPNFGIYWQNAAGERELLAYDPAIECAQPVPARPRTRARAPRYVPWDPSAAYGTFHVQDVYAGPGLEGIARGTVKTLRVVAVESRPAFLYMGSMKAPHDPAFAKYVAYEGDLSGEGVAVHGGTWDVKHVLGEADVAADGACTFEAPACTPVYFQLLDAEGRCVQTMRSWATLMPGENRSCVGCHEPKTAAPPPMRAGAAGVQRLKPAPGQGAHPLLATLDRNGRLDTAADFAGIHASVALEPEAPTVGFSYRRLVQPILDRNCVRCHDGSCTNRPNLTGKPAQDRVLVFSKPGLSVKVDGHRRFTESYLALTSRGRQTASCNWYSSTGISEMLPPYALGSSQSALLQHFTTTHHGVAATPIDRRVVACWIDLAVPFGGSYCEATDWTDDDRRIYDYHQRKRAAFAESERRDWRLK